MHHNWAQHHHYHACWVIASWQLKCLSLTLYVSDSAAIKRGECTLDTSSLIKIVHNKSPYYLRKLPATHHYCKAMLTNSSLITQIIPNISVILIRHLLAVCGLVEWNKKAGVWVQIRTSFFYPTSPAPWEYIHFIQELKRWNVALFGHWIQRHRSKEKKESFSFEIHTCTCLVVGMAGKITRALSWLILYSDGFIHKLTDKVGLSMNRPKGRHNET